MSMDAEGMDWFRRGAVECRSLIGNSQCLMIILLLTGLNNVQSFSFSHLHQNSSSFAAAAVVVA